MSRAFAPSTIGGLGRAVWLGITCAACYFCADRLLDFVAFNEGWTIFWPLNGITIAILIMHPRSDWPAILLGVGLGTGAGELFDNPLDLAILQRLLSLTEVVLSALVLPRFTALEDWLRQPLLYRKFCMSLAVGPITSGLLEAVVAHHLQGQPYGSGFNDWATADALGIAIVMPLALSARSTEFRALFQRQQLTRTSGILLLALLVCGVVFLKTPFALFFLVYPVLLFVDSKLGFGGSALIMPAACLIAVYGETHSLGPFSHVSYALPVPESIALQALLGFQVLALFPASIQFRQRRLLQEELKQTNLQLAALAALDGLTGIPNRRSLDERFASEWRQAARLRQPLTLMMIDIDHFKQYNDLYGHHAGDACLREVAALIANQVHRSRDLAARFGGEEFAVLLPGRQEDAAKIFAESVMRAVAIADIPHSASNWNRVTLSAGCATRVPTEAESPDELLKLADAALYRAKRSGRNKVQFDPAMHPAADVSPAPTRTTATTAVLAIKG